MRCDEPAQDFVAYQESHHDATNKPWQASCASSCRRWRCTPHGQKCVFGTFDGKPVLAPCACSQPHSFELEEDTSAFGDYVRGGIVTQHKEAKTLAFRGLGEATASPGEFLFSDFSKLERPALLHAGFRRARRLPGAGWRSPSEACRPYRKPYLNKKS